MGNVTRTPLNETDNSNLTGGGAGNTRKLSDPVPPFRHAQGLTSLTVQVSFALALIALALILNIVMAIVLQKKLKTLPYIMLLNIVAVDIVTATLNGPFFVLGTILDQLGIILQNYCNVQGFFHATLSTVFLNTVTLIAISRCLAVLQPELYRKIFVNKIVLRFLLLAVWSTSALICVPPMNYKGWGAYKRFEATCWLAWIPKIKDYMAYNSLITIMSLGTAVTSCIFGLYTVYSIRKVGPVSPAQEVLPSVPPPYPGVVDTFVADRPPLCPKAQVNTDVFMVASIQFLLYIILWIPLTVMNSIYLKDWRDIEFRVITVFLFLYMGRTIFNPLICLIASANIRKELFATICQCRCSKEQNETTQTEF